MSEEEATAPPPTDMKLSTVSQQYDRGNKGYLDETEQKLRAMDSQNAGHVSVDKVYALMQEFQAEQKKAVSLRKVVIALVIFAILLTLANIGTAFAAAKLAQDVRIDSEGNLAGQFGNLVGVRSKALIFPLDVNPKHNSSIDGAGRYLQFDLEGGGDARSPLTIGYETASQVFGTVCQTVPNGNKWPGIDNWQCGQSVNCAVQETAWVAGCPEEYRTTLGFKQKPRCDETGTYVNYTYEGYRDNWNYGIVTFTCNMKTKGPCAVFNINCSSVCTIATCGGGATKWFCNEGYGCGCAPGYCTSNGKDEYCNSCYNGQPNAAAVAERALRGFDGFGV